MKFGTLFTMIMTASLAWTQTSADDWEVMNYKDAQPVIRLKKDPKIYLKVSGNPGGSEGAHIISVHPHEKHKHVVVVEYFAGDYGTSQIVRWYNAFLYNTKTKKIISGELPVRYQALNTPKEDQPDQPKWSSTPSSIKVFDPETEKTEIINVK